MLSDTSAIHPRKVIGRPVEAEGPVEGGMTTVNDSHPEEEEGIMAILMNTKHSTLVLKTPLPHMQTKHSNQMIR